jgi:endonuclease YncB( thermonuclease family)
MTGLAKRLLTAMALAALAWAAHAQPCPLAPLGTAKVAAVRDGRTLALAGGRVLRLAAIEVAPSSSAALQALAAGKTLRLFRLGADRDRYGRLVAFASAGEAAQTLQQRLIEEGEARVGARVGNKACADMLLAAERKARAERLGLWADPNFAPLPADNLARLTAERGRFALVEGKVLSVRESGGTIYLNFARRWSQGLSVLIARRQRSAFAAAGINVHDLKDRRIRVRGFLEERRGPIIEAETAEQIELLDESPGEARP